MRYRDAFLAGGVAIAAFAASSASAAVVIAVDKSTQKMTVQVDGATRWQWKASIGRSGHDTPNGTFYALSTDVDHYSKKYDNAPMPHSIFFTSLGHTIHGSFAVRRLGRPRRTAASGSSQPMPPSCLRWSSSRACTTPRS